MMPGWDLAYWPGKPSGHLLDLWRALAQTTSENPEADIVLIEDDVAPCKNALAKAVSWYSPYLTTFCNTRGLPPGVRLVDKSGIGTSQCLKIPAPVAARLVAENPTSKEWQDKKPSIHGGDLVIGRMLRAWGLRYFQHQSLFQHKGAVSLCNPRATLSQHRIARDFPGCDFDALTL
jgi:hypothetical protein